MLRRLGRVVPALPLALLRPAGRLARARPKTTALVLAIVVLGATAAGLYGYARYQWRQAQAAVKDGRQDEAKERLKLCLLVWPRSPEVHRLAARCARLRTDFPAAEEHLKRCMKLEGGASQQTQLEFLLMRAQTGEVDVVVSELFYYVENDDPDSTLILETLARAFIHDLRYGPAYNCLSRWIEVEPTSAVAYHWRAWVLERINSAKAAFDDYERALALDPELVPVRLRLAEILLEERKPDLAAPHLERLRRRFPDRADVQARLGQCRFLQGRPEEARKLLESAVKEMPKDLPLLVHLAKLDLQESRPAEAEAWLRRALAADSADTEAQFTLASALQYQGRKAEAAEVLERYEKSKQILDRANQLLREEAEHPSNDPGPAYEVGRLLLGLGQERLGLTWLNRALMRDPRHKPTHQVLADFYESKGEQKLAAAHRRFLGEAGAKPAGP